MRRVPVLIVLMVCLGLQPHARERVAYSIVSLGPVESWATHINNRGQVAGFTGDFANVRDYRAFEWGRGRVVLLDPAAGYAGSWAMALNARGQVAGSSFLNGNTSEPTLWEKGVAIPLGLLPGFEAGGAEDVNDRGEVVGALQRYSGSFEQRAFVWRRGVMTDLGPAFVAMSGGFSAAWGINNRGQIVGQMCGIRSATGVEACGPFLWDHGRATALGSLGGNGGQALAINDRTEVIGWSATTSGDTDGFLWRNGTMIDLGSTLYPLGINNRGQVVGQTASGHAFVWNDGDVVDLGVLEGSCCSRAEDINDRGEIVGISSAAGTDHQAVLWVPSTSDH